jgi:thiamine phosphate synthase YjbQ (UPF0047 family)
MVHGSIRPRAAVVLAAIMRIHMPRNTQPISDGKLVLGTWRQIFQLECDVRGREHTIVVTVIGDERQSTCN